MRPDPSVGALGFVPNLSESQSKGRICVCNFFDFPLFFFFLRYDRSSDYLRITTMIGQSNCTNLGVFLFFSFLNSLLQFLSWISTPLNLIVQKFEDFFPAHIWHQLTRI